MEMVNQAQRSEVTIAAIMRAARTLFGKRGFAATSIDRIASESGVAKGAVYHHFESKEALFTAVLEAVQADVASAPVPSSASSTDPLDQIAAGVLRYLLATNEPNTRRILLVDAPTVVGWQKWREIDARIFGAGAKAAITYALGANAKASQIDAIVHLLMGSVTEAALVCASSPRPNAQARLFATELRAMLEGVRAAHG
jgi:AcrR family transcriptional regulator